MVKISLLLSSRCPQWGKLRPYIRPRKVAAEKKTSAAKKARKAAQQKARNEKKGMIDKTSIQSGQDTWKNLNATTYSANYNGIGGEQQEVIIHAIAALRAEIMSDIQQMMDRNREPNSVPEIDRPRERRVAPRDRLTDARKMGAEREEEGSAAYRVAHTLESSSKAFPNGGAAAAESKEAVERERQRLPDKELLSAEVSRPGWGPDGG